MDKERLFVWLVYSPDEDLYYAEICNKQGHDIDTEGVLTTYPSQAALSQAVNNFAKKKGYHLTLMNGGHTKILDG
jgi:hypothetical protein|tara:strand:+ start:108 stop:332 length:225 start_codon:yes stop_codon:yes gene_type:complete